MSAGCCYAKRPIVVRLAYAELFAKSGQLLTHMQLRVPLVDAGRIWLAPKQELRTW